MTLGISLSRKPIRWAKQVTSVDSASVQPSIQREEMPEEELQAKHIQREAMPEEEEVQAKLCSARRDAGGRTPGQVCPAPGKRGRRGWPKCREMPEEEEALQTKAIQREEMPEEEMVEG